MTEPNPPTPPSTSDTEFEVLKALWDAGSATVRELLGGPAAVGRSWAYTTLQTLLSRLEQKGYVESDRRGRAHVFRPLVSREEFLGQHLDELKQRVCEGEAVPLMLSLVNGGKLTHDDIRRFRELLDALEAPAPDGPPRPGRRGTSDNG